MAKPRHTTKTVRSDLPAALGQILVVFNLLSLPGLLVVVLLAASNSLPVIAASPYAALAVAVMLLTLTVDILLGLVLMAKRYPAQGPTQRILVFTLVGLGLIILTAKLMYVSN
jgi:hypothetical protein